MKPFYDYVFVTHLPAFYKVNLYNELAKQCQVFVIFIAAKSTIRTKDFISTDCAFDYTILNQECFEKRNKFFSLWRLFKLYRKLNFSKIAVGGWDLLEFWALIFLFPKDKNALILESTLIESKTTGIKGWMKKVFLGRIDVVFPSGQMHQYLLNELGYLGKTRRTLGVGIFNYHPTTLLRRKFSGKFLYVGRLAPEKNVQLLIKVFQALPEYQLTLIGQGPLEKQCKQGSKNNIRILGHVPNSKLSEYYRNHDIFILPSLKEPWGLVVEEALFFGMPVIVSQYAGCVKDLVEDKEVGVAFNPLSEAALCKAIAWSVDHYDKLIAKVADIDFKFRDAHQVKQYIEALS